MIVSEKLIALAFVRNTFLAPKYGVRGDKVHPPRGVELGHAIVGIPDNRDKHRSTVHWLTREIPEKVGAHFRIGIAP